MFFLVFFIFSVLGIYKTKWCKISDSLATYIYYIDQYSGKRFYKIANSFFCLFIFNQDTKTVDYFVAETVVDFIQAPEFGSRSQKNKSQDFEY